MTWEYSKKIGLIKTLKNMGYTWGVPALIYFLNNVKEFIPEDYLPIVLPIVGGIVYFIKNRNENK